MERMMPALARHRRRQGRPVGQAQWQIGWAESGGGGRGLGKFRDGVVAERGELSMRPSPAQPSPPFRVRCRGFAAPWPSVR